MKYIDGMELPNYKINFNMNTIVNCGKLKKNKDN